MLGLDAFEVLELDDPELFELDPELDGLPAAACEPPLDGDACCPANTGDGQLATRMQAFLELLEARG